jgi:hypothetical protein
VLRYVDNILNHNPDDKAAILRYVNQLETEESQQTFDSPNMHRLVFAETFARFYRCYNNTISTRTDNNDWSIDFYKVANFNLMYYQPSMLSFKF